MFGWKPTWRQFWYSVGAISLSGAALIGSEVNPGAGAGILVTSFFMTATGLMVWHDRRINPPLPEFTRTASMHAGMRVVLDEETGEAAMEIPHAGAGWLTLEERDPDSEPDQSASRQHTGDPDFDAIVLCATTDPAKRLASLDAATRKRLKRAVFMGFEMRGGAIRTVVDRHLGKSQTEVYEEMAQLARLLNPIDGTPELAAIAEHDPNPSVRSVALALLLPVDAATCQRIVGNPKGSKLSGPNARAVRLALQDPADSDALVDALDTPGVYPNVKAAICAFIAQRDGDTDATRAVIGACMHDIPTRAKLLRSPESGPARPIARDLVELANATAAGLSLVDADSGQLSVSTEKGALSNADSDQA